MRNKSVSILSISRQPLFVISYWLIIIFVFFLIVNQIFAEYTHDSKKMASMFFSSDLLSIPDFLHNLLYQKGSINDWALPGVTYLFPDIVFSAVIFLFSDHIQLNVAIYAIIQMALFVLAISLIFRSLNDSAPIYRLGLFSGLIALVLFSKNYLTSNELLEALVVSDLHIGQLIMTYAGLALIINYLNSPKRYLLVILFLLIFIMIPSDLIFIATFSLPIMMSLFIITLCNDLNWRQGLKLIGLILIATCLGRLLFTHFPLPYIKIYAGMFKTAKANLHLLPNQLSALYARASWLYHDNRIIAWAWILFFPLSWWSLFFKPQISLTLSTQRQIQFALIFINCNVLMGLMAIVFNDSFTPNFIGFRHIQSVILSPLFIGIPLLLYLHFTFIKKLITHTLAYLLLILCLPLFYLGNSLSLQFNRMINYYPPPAACLDHAIDKYHLNAGIAGYWVFRPFSLFNHYKIPIVEVKNNLSIDHWMNTLQFYRRKDFDFAVIDQNTKSFTHSLFHYGKPNQKVVCPGNYFIYIFNHHQLNFLFNEADVDKLRVRHHHVEYNLLK